MNKINLILYSMLIFMFFATCTAPSSNACVPDTAYSETDATSISFDFEVPKGKGIFEVILTVNTDVAQTPSFLVTPSGSTAGPMILGTLYDTNVANPNSGIQYTVVLGSGIGNYELHIFAKPTDFPYGTFTGTGVDTWNFTVNDLVYGSDPLGEITSWDASFDPVQLAEDLKTEECDIASLTTVTATSTDSCIPLTTYSKTDRTSISFDFEMPKGKGIHEVILTVNTGVAQSPTFLATIPGSTAGPMILGTIYDTNFPDPYSGIQLYIITGSGTGNYEIHIFAKPVDFPGGTFTGAGVDTWNFTVNSLAAGSDPSGEITSWDASFTPVQLFENAGTTECDIAYLTHIE